MTAKKSWIVNIKENIVAIAVTLATLGGIATFAWSNIAEPRVNKMIDVKQAPVLKELVKIFNALEYQNFMMMEELSDSTLSSVNEKFVIKQRGSGK